MKQLSFATLFVFVAVFLFACDTSSDSQVRSGYVPATLVVENSITVSPEPINYSRPISDVLGQDAQTPVTANGDYSVQAREMEKIELSECPADFTRAYLRHIEAWKLAADIQKALAALRSDENVAATAIASILARLVESDATPIITELKKENELKYAEQQASVYIYNTWNDVERLARIYGARLSGL